MLEIVSDPRIGVVPTFTDVVVRIGAPCWLRNGVPFGWVAVAVTWPVPATGNVNVVVAIPFAPVRAGGFVVAGRPAPSAWKITSTFGTGTPEASVTRASIGVAWPAPVSIPPRYGNWMKSGTPAPGGLTVARVVSTIVPISPNAKNV